MLRLHVETRNALQEHLGWVVAPLDLGAVDQTQEQRVALGLGDVFQLAGIEHLRLRGEVADLGGSQASQNAALVANHFEPAQVADELVEV